MNLKNYVLLITELASLVEVLSKGDSRSNIEAKYDKVIEMANNIALLADTDKKEFMEEMDKLTEEECRADAEADLQHNNEDYE